MHLAQFLYFITLNKHGRLRCIFDSFAFKNRQVFFARALGTRAQKLTARELVRFVLFNMRRIFIASVDFSFTCSIFGAFPIRLPKKHVARQSFFLANARTSFFLTCQLSIVKSIRKFLKNLSYVKTVGIFDCLTYNYIK